MTNAQGWEEWTHTKERESAQGERACPRRDSRDDVLTWGEILEDLRTTRGHGTSVVRRT
jgi:hypothetical protein